MAPRHLLVVTVRDADGIKSVRLKINGKWVPATARGSNYERLVPDAPRLASFRAYDRHGTTAFPA